MQQVRTSCDVAVKLSATAARSGGHVPDPEARRPSAAAYVARDETVSDLRHTRLWSARYRRSLPGMSDEEEPKFVLVPSSALSGQALDALIQEFVTREGTDYGLRVYTLEEKTKSVTQQIERGDVLIAFDIESESATLVARKELPPSMVKQFELLDRE